MFIITKFVHYIYGNLKFCFFSLSLFLVCETYKLHFSYHSRFAFHFSFLVSGNIDDGIVTGKEIAGIRLIDKVYINQIVIHKAEVKLSTKKTKIGDLDEKQKAKGQKMYG